MTSVPYTLPILITMGDPSGVGAEVTIKALSNLPEERRNRFLVIGDMTVLEKARNICGDSNIPLVANDTPEKTGAIRVLHVPIEGLPQNFGVLSPRCGEAAFQYIKMAVDMLTAKKAVGMVTAPINKEALNTAGHHYDGHTGMLAHLTGCKASWMLLASETLNVIHVSTHVSLHEAIDKATPERVLETIRIGNTHLQRMGLTAPRIAVAGLNPHCGENGLFGNEDKTHIAPAISQAQTEGINVKGPIPADTAYYRAHKGEFDLVIAQYHDQGHIPIKLIAFDSAVNVSLGLPIDRCSVDHGTAFDIAGTGKANHVNMMAAISYAEKLAMGNQ